MMKGYIITIMVLMSLSAVALAQDIDSMNEYAVHYASFEETGTNFTDEIHPIDWTCTPSLCPNTGEPGIIGNGLRYISSNQDKVRHTATIENASTKSLSVWVMVFTNTSGGIVLNDAGAYWGASYGQMAGFTDSEDEKLRCFNYDGSPNGVNSFALNLSEWYHLACSHEDDNVHMWINGRYQGNASSGDTSVTTWSWALGSSGTTGQRVLDGKIDELSVFMNYSLGQEEVDFLYASGSPNEKRQYPFFIDCIDNDEDCLLTEDYELTGNKNYSRTITLQGGVTFDGNGYTITRNDTTGNFILVNGSHVEIINLDYISNGTNGGVIEVSADTHNVTIKDNNFTHEINGLVTTNSNTDNLVIQDNTIRGSYQALFISGEDYESDDVIIRNNEIDGDTTTGNHLVRITGLDGLYYENNTVRYNASNNFGHLYLESVKNALLEGNNHTTNRPAGLEVYNGDPLENVTFLDNRLGGGFEDEPSGTGNTDHRITFINTTFDGDSALDKGNYTFINSTFGDNEMTLNTDTQINATYEHFKNLNLRYFAVTRPFIMSTTGSTVSLDIDTFTTHTRIDTSLEMGDDYVSVSAGSFLNRSATITFRGVEEQDVPYRDGVLCGVAYCSNINNEGGVLTFEVTSFSNYTYGEGNDTAPTITSSTPQNKSIFSAVDLLLNFTTNFTDDESDYVSTRWEVGSVVVANTTNNTQGYDNLTGYSFEGEGEYVVMFEVYQMDNASQNDSVSWNVTIDYPDVPVNYTNTNVTGSIDFNVEELEASMLRLMLILLGLSLSVFSTTRIGKEYHQGSIMAIVGLLFVVVSGVAPLGVVGVIAIVSFITIAADLYNLMKRIGK